MVHINGEDLDLAGRSLQSYLDDNEYVPGRFVVEYNLRILRQDSYEDIILQDGDCVEIVMFMGGGSALPPVGDPQKSRLPKGII